MRRWLCVRLVKCERGIALVMAIGITTVLAIAGTTAIAYSTSSTTESSQTYSRQSAFSLAEAGVNNMMAVLNLPTNNALDPDLLPKCTTNDKKYTDPAATRTSTSSWLHVSLGGGSVDYCGTLVRKDALWYVTSIGSTRNPNKSSDNVTRTLEATVTVTPTITQPLNNPVWNYLYAGHTGSTCDQTLNNNISGASRMYVAGNLCLSPNVALDQSTVIVGGDLDVSNNASVGASTSLSTRVETYVGGNCRYSVGSWGACSGNQDARHIYSKLSDGVDDRREPHCAGGCAAGRRLRDVVRERDPRALAVVLDLERHAADVRHQLPLPRQQRLERRRPHAHRAPTTAASGLARPRR